MPKISYDLVNVAKNIHSHQHDFAQIVIPIDSTVFIQTKERDYVIDSNSLIYIPTGFHHKYRCKEGDSSLRINFSDHLIKKTDAHKFNSVLLVNIDNKIKCLIELILYELSNTPNYKSMEYLFFYLYDKIIESRTSPSLDYISQHYDEHITVKELASIEHYNENYYREWFKDRLGLRPKEYIQKLRIEKAKELLVSTKYSISEIAIQVGYDHSSSFCRAFKHLETIGPKDYRKSFS